MPILLLAWMAAAEPLSPGVVHPAPGVSIRPPAGWTVSTELFWAMHWRDVLVTMSTSTDTLRVLPPDGSQVDWKEQVARQVPPGVVYLDLGKPQGPPLAAEPYAWFPESRPEARIARFLEEKTPVWETERVAAFRLGFQKWGEQWDAWIYAGNPFAEGDLEAAFASVASISFAGVPIDAPAKAVEAAIPHLPPEAAPDPEWEEGCASIFFRMQVDVEEEGDGGYLVRFLTLDGTQERVPMDSYRFRVSRAGTVEGPERESPGSGPKPEGN